MRIAWLMPNLHITGGARTAIELGSEMVRRGHRFDILIPRGRCQFENLDGVNVIECGLHTKSPLLAVGFGMAAMVVKIPTVDVIVASMPPYALLASEIALWQGVKRINYVLNDDVHFFDDRSFIRSGVLLALYRSVARFSIRRASIFTNSHWTAVQCVTEGGLKPAAYVPHGYDPKVFTPKDSENTTGIVHLVTVGRHVKWKGLSDLIAALNQVDQQRCPFILRIISQDILDLSAARFPHEVVKPKNDTELAEHYRWGDVYIHSSWFEGFGMPPLEAQACGLAVISTFCGGVNEFLKDGHNALLVPHREPRSMAKAVENLISDHELRRKFVRIGLETSSEFTWKRVADKFEAGLVSVVNDR